MVRLAARDLRTNMGSNVRLIEEETGLDPWEASSANVKSALMFNEQLSLSPPP